MKKIKIIVLVVAILIITIYFLYGDNLKSINKFIPNEYKLIVREYLFPKNEAEVIIERYKQKVKNEAEVIIERYKQEAKRKDIIINKLQKKGDIQKLALNTGQNYLLDLIIKNNLSDLVFTKRDKIKINDKSFLTFYFPSKNVLSQGINKSFPGSAFLDFHDDNLFLLSAIGITGYAIINNKNEKLRFLQIKNNIKDFINEKQFKKHRWNSTKDLKIFNNKIFVSYINEVKDGCFNTSIIYADLIKNSTSIPVLYEELTFKTFFSPNECAEDSYWEFNGNQSGGRIINLDSENIVFSTGDFRHRQNAQDKKSILGKILKINIKTKNYTVLSMGHRNPQGLYYDKKNNFILSTEHGPKGGDEINLIKLDQSQIQNFGWPIASYGEHYASNTRLDKFPLLKSHKDNGFIEPLEYFVPSIGISQIIGFGNNKYAYTSLKHKHLDFVRLNKDVIEEIKSIVVGERIRDAIYKENKIYLFLEDTAQIGIISNVDSILK